MAENNTNQTRFFTAVTLSLGVLLLWSFLFPAPKPDANKDANQPQTAVVQNQTATAPANENQPSAPVQQNAGDNVPNRAVTIKTPLYAVKLDSRGALPTSWVLLKNKIGDLDRPLSSISSTKNDQKPLELISPEAVNRRELPFKIITGDANFDSVINDRNYQINNQTGDEIVLNNGDERKIEFALRDDANQIEAVKTFTFRADSYVSDVQTKLTRNGNAVGNARLQIGASIGDQGVQNHTYYQIEPEAVAVTSDDGIERHRGTEIVKSNQTSGSLPINKPTQWAGVGDTYFAMAAVPAQTAGNVEFQSIKYEVPLAEPRTNGIWGFFTGDKIYKEDLHLTSVLLPITADGAGATKVFVGAKDHYLLTDASQQISQSVGRTVDLDNFINYYGWLSFLVRPLAIRILWALRFLSTITNNYGVSILIFTLFFYTCLFPLRWYQSRSFKKAAKNAPKMKEMQDRYKEYQAKNIPLEDPRMRELQMEQLKLTKDAVPLGGCIPMLLQFPLLFAMLAAITISLDFRQASFLWLPDLSAADPFHILNFGFAGSMILAMLFAPTAAAMTPEQQMQQRMMLYMMPLMMLWVTWAAPSGLLVYWLAGNIIGFFQQLLINRLNKSKDDPPTAATDNKGTMSKKQMKTSLSPS